jgi:hypothetical protein
MNNNNNNRDEEEEEVEWRAVHQALTNDNLVVSFSPSALATNMRRGVRVALPGGGGEMVSKLVFS